MGIPEHINLFLGFDPGGEGVSKTKGNFGWSICKEVSDEHKCLKLECLKTGLPKNAWEAVEQVDDVINSLTEKNVRVLAAGIDAPLLWNGRGTRMVDHELRQALRRSGFLEKSVNGTVQAVNSLQGSCVVQGTLLVRHLGNKRWAQNLTIMESHPTAFRYLLSHVGQREMVRMAVRFKAKLATCKSAHKRKDDVKKCTTCKRDSHRQDATLAAMAAWAAIRRQRDWQWQNLYEGELGLINPFQIPISYWMPIPD